MSLNNGDDDILDGVGNDIDIHTQEILLAASNHDIPQLRNLLRNTLATVQDPETGYTALHAAITACEPEDTQSNGVHDIPSSDDARSKELEAAAETVRFLIKHGAVWNEVDSNDETPGCIAYRLGLDEIYQITVDAGVRAELLVNRLHEYERLEDEAGDTTHINGDEDMPSSTPMNNYEEDVTKDVVLNSIVSPIPTLLEDRLAGEISAADLKDITKVQLDKLGALEGFKVLSIGKDLDSLWNHVQQLSPALHHIIESEPTTRQRLKRQVDNDVNVKIHDGRWQEILPGLLDDEDELAFDLIFFSNPHEAYKDLRELFTDYIVHLLRPDGRFSFLNMIGASRQVYYDVFQKVLEMDLFEAGYDIDWEETDTSILPRASGTPWRIRTYKLPICKVEG